MHLQGYSFRYLKAANLQVNKDRSELKRLVLTRWFLVITVLGIGVFALLDAYFGLLFIFLLDLVALGSFLGALYLINHRYIHAGKLVIFISSNLMLLLTASSQGRAAGNTFIFFPLITGIFTLFSYREWPHILFCVVLTLCNFLLLEVTNYAFLKTSVLPTGYEYLGYLTNGGISIGMVGYFSYFHAKANALSEHKLKKLNARLKVQNQQLKKTNRELDSFVYKASHDLRSPLTSLLGLIDIARLETEIDKLNEYSLLQEKLVRKLDTYIQDILSLSRNSNLALTVQAINFSDLVAQAFTQLQYIEHFPNIDKRIHIHSSTTPFYGDEIRLRILLNNLLANAIRYADLSKEQSYIQIDFTVSSAEAVLEILDNGIGIAPMHLDKIFHMFYRATAKTAGSGLGLYIVGEVLEKIGGTVQVTSQVGHWTCFQIQLPNPSPLHTPSSVDSHSAHLAG